MLSDPVPGHSSARQMPSFRAVRVVRRGASPHPSSSPELRGTPVSRVPSEEPWELRGTHGALPAAEELPWELRPDNPYLHQDVLQGNLHGRAPSVEHFVGGPRIVSPSPSRVMLRVPGEMTAPAPVPVFPARMPSVDPQFRPNSPLLGRLGSFHGNEVPVMVMPSHARVGMVNAPPVQQLPSQFASPRQDSSGRLMYPVAMAQPFLSADGRLIQPINSHEARRSDSPAQTPLQRSRREEARSEDPTKVRQVLASSPHPAPRAARGDQQIQPDITSITSQPGFVRNTPPLRRSPTPSVEAPHSSSSVTQRVVPTEEGRERGRGHSRSASTDAASRHVSVPVDALNVVRQELNVICSSMATRSGVQVELFNRSMCERIGNLEEQVSRLVMPADEVNPPSQVIAGGAAGGGQLDPVKLNTAMADLMEKEKSGSAGNPILGPVEQQMSISIHRVEDNPKAGTSATMSVQTTPVETSSQTSTRISGNEKSVDSADYLSAPTWAEVPSAMSESTIRSALNDPHVMNQQESFSCDNSAVSDHPSETCIEMAIVKDGPFDRLGMDVRHLNGGLSIVSIIPGCALDRANKKAESSDPPGPMLLVGDIIHQVNDVTEPDDLLVAECQEKSELHILAVRV